MYLVLFSILCLPTVPAFGADILGVFTMTSLSHQIVYRTLMVELNKRGHNITVVTPNPVNDPNLTNYREIDVSFYYKIYEQKVATDPARLRLGLLVPEFVFYVFLHLSNDMCHAYYSSPQVQALINANPKFDLLITEFGFAPCFYALSKFSGYKQVGISSFQTSAVLHSSLGNPINPSYIQDVNLGYGRSMTFFQRLRTFVFVCFTWFVYLYAMVGQTMIARVYLGEDLPHLWDFERNLSVMLVNAHFTMNYPRPNGPVLVEIGGPPFHLAGKKPNPLPQDLKAFLEDAPDGVVYFSLGTNVRTSNISSREEEILLESFSKIKQKVLWKWENENLKVNLKNVMKRKWFPQVDVLAHPNVKVFVTQAGLQSVGEAIAYHVPMIVMPFFADQNHNARKMEAEGVALFLDFDSLDVPTFIRAVNEIVYNETFRQNIVRFSALVKDQPMPPLERAIWWTEYVIRHNGAPHLRSAAATMPWYQYLMLDVLAVIFLVLFIVFYVVYLIVRTFLRWLFKTQKPKTD